MTTSADTPSFAYSLMAKFETIGLKGTREVFSIITQFFDVPCMNFTLNRRNGHSGPMKFNIFSKKNRQDPQESGRYVNFRQLCHWGKVIINV